MEAVGVIDQLIRYPVKSFAGEELQKARIEAYGIYGDRSHAFIDETKEGWSRFVTARQIPHMLAYKAQMIEESRADRFPDVHITSPDGRNLNWNEQLLAELQAFTKQRITMHGYDPQSSELMAVDAESILIVTDSSLRRLEELWGKKLDRRRFRANLILSMGDQEDREEEWIGKRLKIGNVELQVNEACERCSMITIDPEQIDKDSTLLRIVNEEMNLKFGVYASVMKTGDISVGDAVYVTN
ncbi:MOSC domain protein [compost metagenome]